ncbi:hypothetical protein [Bdellovibrio reynosensis]|uniref:Organic solvent tolerance-like N-terminal domain-containing protein n=1 Tax=Bdellovibrio reynosensis TaxID=2835041 RepID=A0ABY4CGK4_9BACT|nr:hypothetical protein [Bdellovibrio reynosensis]UOF02698.1 hypothetical protein MNR06_07015 [Bdellovibrio reynosensis]
MQKLATALLIFLAPLVSSAEGIKPISVSYENLMRCFPELQDESLSFKVDLNRLKELIDEKFVTSQSQLRQRKVHYLDAEKQAMNLILRTKFMGHKKMDTELFLQQVDAKGVVTDIRMTGNQRINPKQDVINNFLLGATIKSDEYSYNDTKLNGIHSTYRRNFKDIEEYELTDKANRRSILCEKKPELGTICTCSKK